MTDATAISTGSSVVETAADGTPLRHPDRPVPQYRPLTAYHHFRELLKDKEDTSHVFRIFEALPHKSFMPRVRNLVLSEQGERLRAEEPFLPPILDDHDALRKMPKGSVAHAYCDFMESEGLSAAGLVAESEKLGRRKYGDLIEWYGFRNRDTHDLMHVLTVRAAVHAWPAAEPRAPADRLCRGAEHQAERAWQQGARVQGCASGAEDRHGLPAADRNADS